MIYLAQKHNLGKCSLYYLMKGQRPYRSALVLQTSYFDPQDLAVD